MLCNDERRDVVTELVPAGLLIGGEWRTDTRSGTLTHINPANGVVLGAFVTAGEDDIAAAVEAARSALPAWRAMAAGERQKILIRIADLLAERSEILGKVGTLESGILPMFTQGAPFMAGDWFRYYAGWIDKMQGDAATAGSHMHYTLLEPYGVVAIILTWNGPIGSIGMKVAAALAAGCCIVLKPPELAPFTANLFGEICIEAGLPPGVVNIVAGEASAGDFLVRHPGIDKISFTGGPETARHIQAACARNLVPLVLELGGKSANIIFEDADLDTACAAAAGGITALSGQVCIAPSRLLVQESVYDAVVDRVVGALSAIKVGDPRDAATTMGPVISDRACRRIQGMIDHAKGDGAKLLLGGDRIDRDGYFMPPTVFGDVDNKSRIAQDEVFGPVLTIIRFSTDEQAVALANDSPYGLAAYLHTDSLGRAHRLASALDVGMISINCGGFGSPSMRFGGIKQSGHGVEGGLAGLLEYVRIKQVSIGLD
jgi:aldehyde dehydrogenase (NAD+)